MALEHVCLLTKHGALPVSPEVAERDYYPQYDPRARAKNYFCTLCHQYVSLVPSGRYHAHFRHSRGEQNKECPDRADETPAYQAFLRGVHVPRLRLAWEKGASSPQFFVGLSRRILEAAIWRSLQRSVTEGFAVTIAVNGGEAMRYNAARFRADGLTAARRRTRWPSAVRQAVMPSRFRGSARERCCIHQGRFLMQRRACSRCTMRNCGAAMSISC